MCSCGAVPADGAVCVSTARARARKYRQEGEHAVAEYTRGAHPRLLKTGARIDDTGHGRCISYGGVSVHSKSGNIVLNSCSFADVSRSP